jgi:pimeloyl-ACP methyl ester carboxylesterase
VKPSPRVLAWQRAGTRERVGDHEVHVHHLPGSEPALVLLHGFPSSSFDFRGLLPHLGDHEVLTFDFLGFGLSDKPAGFGYSLFKQADLVEELVRRHLPDRSIFLVAHDMGTSVATELLARDLDGTGVLDLSGAMLFNGSIVLDQASLTPSQKLLRSRFGALAARLSNRRVFRQQFGSLFSAEHPLTDAEAADQWFLLCMNGGRARGHELIAYLDERVEHAGRWHGAVRHWSGPLSLIWGLRDPVATVAVLDALRDLRPAVPCAEMPELGHYPQLEAPERVAAEVLAAVDRGRIRI